MLKFPENKGLNFRYNSSIDLSVVINKNIIYIADNKNKE